jgi:Zn-dependent protease
MNLHSFSPREKRELVIATGLFVLVEISLYLSPLRFFELLITDIASWLGSMVNLVILGVFCVPLFLFHELGHKFVAQAYNLKSEFRFIPDLALISLISVFLPLKIIAPGVVLSSGGYNGDKDARISLAGPLVNIILGGFFLILASLLLPEWTILLFVSKFSFDMAMFNLLPFSVLDGSKVIRWHPTTFWVVFGITVGLWLFHPLGMFGVLLIQ